MPLVGRRRDAVCQTEQTETGQSRLRPARYGESVSLLAEAECEVGRRRRSRPAFVAETLTHMARSDINVGPISRLVMRGTDGAGWPSSSAVMMLQRRREPP